MVTTWYPSQESRMPNASPPKSVLQNTLPKFKFWDRVKTKFNFKFCNNSAIQWQGFDYEDSQYINPIDGNQLHVRVYLLV